METVVSSSTKEVKISDRQPVVLIGERINPTGRRKLADALRVGDMEFIRREALTQVEDGADILDINGGIADANEVDLLPQMIQVIADTVDVPLCIDSSNPEALKEALKVYYGKPLINSVTGEEQSLEKILPLVKEYKSAVIGLTMDDEGIPEDSERRVVIAHKIVERAAAMGIPRHDIIIDCLAMPMGVDGKTGAVFIEAVRKVKAELGVNLTLGNSNVSFGLPDRNLINCIFLAIAIASGVTCPIVDVAWIRPAALVADLTLGYDDYAMRYIKTYRRLGKNWHH